MIMDESILAYTDQPVDFLHVQSLVGVEPVLGILVDMLDRDSSQVLGHCLATTLANLRNK